MTLDATKAAPLYRQLAEHLRQSILEGKWRNGDMIPSESDMMKQYQVSRMTVRQAIALLEQDGLVRKEQGRGTFVVFQSAEQDMLGFHDFAKDLRRRGRVGTFRILRFELISVPKALEEIFGMTQTDQVYLIHRLKIADGKPVMFERLYLPRDFVPDLPEDEVHRVWLSELLPRRYGFHLERARKVVQPIVIGEEEARVLGVSPRSIGLLVDRITWAKEQIARPLVVTRSIVRGDMARFYVDVNRADPQER